LPDGRFRIGAVSKITGIPVSTLRIWETRYGAFRPVKSQGQQRLYAEHDVSKALLIKQLTQSGHAIGTVAHLDGDALRSLLSQNQPLMSSRPTGEPVAMAVVGLTLANRLESKTFTQAQPERLFQITDVWSDLADAHQGMLSGQPKVLMVKINSLQPDVHARILELIRRFQFEQTMVLYYFAPESVVQAMKHSGLTVRREPLSDMELSELLQSVLFVDHSRAQEFGTSGKVISRRKYSDAVLHRVAGISTNVLCECPRHVAELISQLCSFEDYSQECLNKNAEDAHLHAYLRSISGSARELFENALEKIAQHEGIDLLKASS
jgi:DNA-binding transcriptional MerR regulator